MNGWFSRPITVEICVSDSHGLMIAARNGAHRAKLASVAGLTPTYGAILHTAKAAEYVIASGEATQSTFSMHVSIRPRLGEYVYRDDEYAVMGTNLGCAIDLGATGVEFGALTVEGQVDLVAVKGLLKIAKEHTKPGRPVQLTFNQAIDQVPDRDLMRTLDQLLDLGFTRIVTRGGPLGAVNAAQRVAKMVKHSRGRQEVQLCGGITPENMVDLLRATGATAVQLNAFHMLSPGTGPLGEHYVTNPEMVSQAVERASNL